VCRATERTATGAHQSTEVHCGPRDGFYIVKPDKKMILDVNPVTIVKELNKLLRRIQELENGSK